MDRQWNGRGWSVHVDDDVLVIRDRGGMRSLDATQFDGLTSKRSWLRWELRLDGQRVVRMPGIRRRDAKTIALAPAIWAAVSWAESTDALVKRSTSAGRWIARETIDDVLSARPKAGLLARATRLGITAMLDDHTRDCVALLDDDFAAYAEEANESILNSELEARREFFDRIERQPLTEEQSRAVICFDNRVQVIAAAGSGKTSVMVARAAYAVARGFVAPDRILLLAFNKAAATELQERVEERLRAAAIDPTGIRASTFHAFGLAVIGGATAAKPRLAPWIDSGRDIETVQRIVDELRDSSPEFCYKWDLYRLLFADTAATPTGGDHDAYDRETSTTGFGTFKGEVVRSHGERLIADWLYLNGVQYQYEHPYTVNVADVTHSQYRPDFYYPDIDAWHEHWALDRDGRPPKEFIGYAEGMAWKKGVHQTHGTTLIETTWADIVYGSGLYRLSEQLTDLGVELDWNPDRPTPGTLPMKHEDLARLMRTFMTHVKSSSLDAAKIARRLQGERRWLSGYRTQLFLDIYWPIHDEWNGRLRAENLVDFEDMLVMAAGQLEAGAFNAHYDLILVDEFQDVSHARARLVECLVRQPGKFLLAVGDDWQSINRFAGADISVMTSFEEWFGTGPSLRLTTTFRCPQSTCDVASAFVSKNPRQVQKVVKSARARAEYGPPVTLIRSDDAGAAVRTYLRHLSEEVESGEIPPGRSGRVTVNVLGRYQFDRDVLPDRAPSNLEVTFRTAHGSKGLEADYVIIPKMVVGRYGFPSAIADDPILDLVMVAPDDYPHAEERRLFYVALTRARRAVTLVTQPGRESPFVAELIKEQRVTIADVDGNPVTELIVCAACGQGTMVQRSGRYGAFLGCSRFPACKNTQQLVSLDW